MGISIDFNQLELVKDFSWFLQIMKEPEKYQSFLDNTNKTLKEARIVLGLVQTKEQADKYLEDAREKVAQWAEDDKKKEENFAVEQTKKRDYLSSVENQLTSLNEKARKANSDADEKLADAKMKLEAVDLAKNEADTLVTSLSEQKAVLQNQQEVLTEKLDRVKRMLGE